MYAKYLLERAKKAPSKLWGVNLTKITIGLETMEKLSRNGI